MRLAGIAMAVVCGLGLLCACTNGAVNGAVDDSMAAVDSIVAVADSTTMATDTVPDAQGDAVEGKSIDISLPLYTFKNPSIGERLQQTVGKWKDDYDALEITYWPTADTISTYGVDSLPYCYNLLVNSVHYEYNGNAYEDVADQVAGCCMIGNKLCYITNRTTRERLFVRTTERKRHTVYSSNTVCPCSEYEAYMLLGEDESLFYLPLEELHRVSVPGRK